MAIAIEWFTAKPSGTAAKYDALLAELKVNPGGPHPGVGCLFHMCRVGPDGLHGFDVWDTQQHFDEFAANKLGPAAAKVGMELPHTKTYEVHAFLTAH
jgi:hypothetical protein